ncbi:class I SAM-dependent methyltransferase [Maridesulfovibrio bastinii]|uniref:class I SAM-dependent methyltransferase n=1 Tax=Maridesulfovibrio bastinii TaxID=47157 RepID=UPI000417FEFB|nr:class I SAM-dependent methyltransferase [Maridesulfovibrio bastinii]
MGKIKINKTDLFHGVQQTAKYHNSNFLAGLLVKNFLKNILMTFQEVDSKNIFEVGSGEGHISGLLALNGFHVRGCDICNASIENATREAKERNLDITFEEKSIYDLGCNDITDVVLCCEVLEHLTDPELAFKKLLSITGKDLIVSVPNEPLWHILNMCRGKYLNALGNTPGHFQHWTKAQFVKMVSSYAEVVSVRTPLPWTIVHCKPHKY